MHKHIKCTRNSSFIPLQQLDTFTVLYILDFEKECVLYVYISLYKYMPFLNLIKTVAAQFHLMNFYKKKSSSSSFPNYDERSEP